MRKVIFDKERAERYLQSIQDAKPFTPDDKDGRWTLDELVTLGGLCLHMIYMQKRAVRSVGIYPLEIIKPIHNVEHLEAVYSVFYDDGISAIEFVATLMDRISGGEYEVKYEDHVGLSETRRGIVTPVSGFKDNVK